MCADTIQNDAMLSVGHESLPKFSASDHIFVSTRVAKHFPGLFESAIVLSFKDPLPNYSGFYWGRVRAVEYRNECMFE